MIAFIPKPSSHNTVPYPDQVGTEQVEALFGAVRLSVLAAALLSVMLASAVHRLGYLDPLKGLCWVAYISSCAASHIALSWFYRRSKSTRGQWRFWANWFTAISLAEGFGWGWATIGLAAGANFEVECLPVIATLGLAAGSIPAFSPSLPAFLALFVPATLPYAIASFASDNEVQRITAPMAFLYIGVVGGLGLLSNRSLRQRIDLKIRTEELAINLRRQKDIAEEANLAKSSFLAAASHDLRQPIHALSLFVGALRQIPMPENAGRLLEQIDASTNAMDSLFSTLLDISRLDAGVMTVHRRPFAINPVLERVCFGFAGEAAAKNLTLTYVPCSAIVDSDPTLIERIARNLVANAVRYTDSGRIVVGCRRREGSIAMQVWDTGRGIPHDKQERVFLEYYQLGKSERDREKGLGLGLAIVRRLTDLLDCKLALWSRPGSGSCFEVSIACAKSGVIPVETPDDELVSTPTTGLVVVVDDEQAIRAGMSSLLTGWGHEVVAVGSVDEAIRLLSSYTVRPDLIICDFRLRDGENGMEAIDLLRAEYNEDIPAMLITGDMAVGRLLDAKTRGVVLLYKPVPNGKLRAAITNLIATRIAGPLPQ
ncbi:hybrid sensor histidine kinase/response regulator [Paraburkholderia bryophila]|uniref:ATP-binding response regulator n=1 Tax=Paraburkholderia bryophila TaxID=420952 RepID=UPI00234AE70C|nr:hybrid sensor histidine kinase/response regulator [Paraburkholderia bryophila]WCM22581.1 hybrid sensor histidine kinase/response regulator [Paraburkholderia bryophila]